MTTLRATYALEFDWDGDGSFADEIDVSDDLIHGVITRRFSGPLARVASAGRAELTLRNADKAYSPPLQANVRPRRGVRLRMTYGATTKTLFRGYISGIRPTFGERRERRVTFRCVDAMEMLDSYEGPIALLENVTADEIVAAVVSSVYTPAATNYETGINRFPFSSDRWEAGARSISRLTVGESGETPTVRASQKILAACVSDWGRFFIAGDGTPTFYNRHHMPFDTTTALTLTDAVAMGYEMSDTGVYNHVAVTCHPRSIGEAYEVLGRISQRDAPALDTGASQTFTVHFRDSANTALRLGGKDVLVPVAGVDLIATDDPAGEGNDVTVYILGALDIYGDRADVELTNTSGGPAYIQRLQIRGIAVRVREPITVVATDDVSIAANGMRELPIDAALMSTQAQARALAEHLLDYYHEPLHDVRGVKIYANSNATHMAAVRDLELCDRVVLSEAQTGLSAQPLHVYGIRHEIGQGRIHSITLDLEQAYDYGADPFIVHGPPPTGSLIDGTDVVIY